MFPQWYRSQEHLPLTLCMQISSQSASLYQKLKGLRLLLYLQANQLICHRLIDSGRTHETPGSRTKNVVTHGTVGSMNFIFKLIFLAHQIPRGDTEHGVGLHHSQRTLSLGKPYLLNGATSKSAYALPWRETLYLFYWLGNKYAFCPGDR